MLIKPRSRLSHFATRNDRAARRRPFNQVSDKKLSWNPVSKLTLGSLRRCLTIWGQILNQNVFLSASISVKGSIMPLRGLDRYCWQCRLVFCCGGCGWRYWLTVLALKWKFLNTANRRCCLLLESSSYFIDVIREDTLVVLSGGFMLFTILAALQGNNNNCCLYYL